MMTFRRRLGMWVTGGGFWYEKRCFSCLCWPDQSQRGSLFTLFLYSPLLAFSSVCGLNSVRAGLWERAQEFLRKVYRDIGQMITRSRTIGMWRCLNGWEGCCLRGKRPVFHSVLVLTDQAFLQFFGDEFLRLLLIRFVFCSASLRLHKLFRVRSYYQSSNTLFMSMHDVLHWSRNPHLHHQPVPLH